MSSGFNVQFMTADPQFCDSGPMPYVVDIQVLFFVVGQLEQSIGPQFILARPPIVYFFKEGLEVNVFQ